MLRLTAERADIAAFTGASLVPGDKEGKLAPVNSTEFGQRVACYREFAPVVEELRGNPLAGPDRPLLGSCHERSSYP